MILRTLNLHASVIPFTTVTDYYILSDIWISHVRPQIWNSWPRVWKEICRLLLKSLAEVLEIKYLVQEHRPRICKLVLKSRLKPWTDTKTLGRKFQSLAKGFRCAAGHLKFRYQIWRSNLLLYIDNINILLHCEFKDQIWWNPRPDIWSQELRLKIWGLAYESRLKS